MAPNIHQPSKWQARVRCNPPRFHRPIRPAAFPFGETPRSAPTSPPRPPPVPTIPRNSRMSHQPPTPAFPPPRVARFDPRCSPARSLPTECAPNKQFEAFSSLQKTVKMTTFERLQNPPCSAPAEQSLKNENAVSPPGKTAFMVHPVAVHTHDTKAKASWSASTPLVCTTPRISIVDISPFPCRQYSRVLVGEIADSRSTHETVLHRVTREIHIRGKPHFLRNPTPIRGHCLLAERQIRTNLLDRLPRRNQLQHLQLPV